MHADDFLHRKPLLYQRKHCALGAQKKLSDILFKVEMWKNMLQFLRVYAIRVYTVWCAHCERSVAGTNIDDMITVACEWVSAKRARDVCVENVDI